VDLPLDLNIADPRAVTWTDEGLAIQSPTLLSADVPPARLFDAVGSSNALTLEAWITPADASQDGPARILTLSANGSNRNVTLGQDGNTVDLRLRTTRSDRNGLPSVSTPAGSLGTRPVLIVATFESSGKARIFLDGEPVADRDFGGDLSNWDRGFQLALGNELTRDRPWIGTLHRVSIYDRALSAEEIQARVADDPRSHRSPGDVPERYDLTNLPARGGLLTQGSTLVVGGDNASMVTRGLFVLHDLLDSQVGNPPPCVDTTPLPSRPGLSQRSIAMGRIENPSCGGCHSKFEPLAFGLERFDGIGGYHDVDEYGNELRDDGEILFPGADQTVSYRNSSEFMDLLAASDRVRSTLTRRLVQFALGRPLVESDLAIVDQIHAQALEDGGTYTSLMTALVMSDLVLMTRTEPQPEETP
jgi:hypothetical protein